VKRLWRQLRRIFGKLLELTGLLTGHTTNFYRAVKMLESEVDDYWPDEEKQKVSKP
jgi:hypothetical protein